MSRHIRGLDISIRGDELEQHRIRLENNLQFAEPSYRLSSVSDEDEDLESIEYPRHNSGPAAFTSFEIPSRDHYDGDTQSQIHPWSYRTVDDEDGINPYAGETMSTAAHHASALTLNAGLGGRAGRRDVSLSGAEYDPDRPLHDMIAGVDSKLSVFDIEASRSKYPGVGSVTFDPLVVDSTAELDRVLQSGYAPAYAQPQPIQSPLHSSSSSSTSDSDTHPASRPKLSDALRRVSFSPQRPRSNAGSPAMSTRALPNDNMPTPKPRRRPNIFPSPQQPQVRLQPPTPSSVGSQFSRMARGITREIEHAQQHTDRNPFDVSGRQDTSTRPGNSTRQDTSIRQGASMSMRQELSQRQGTPAKQDTSLRQAARQQTPKQPTPRKASAMKQRPHAPTPKGKIQLPDVTGLTSAVESPAKMGSEFYVYRAEGSPRENEARLMGMLNSVQSKLQHLEEENGISRRRVRELELELEVCKRDVARERTRVLEREEVIVQQQRDASISGIGRRSKGKARAKEVSVEHDALHERYREAVEEKKALEALITTLRTHLTRLTAELSSHRELLTELRELRDSDVKALKQKSSDIERLKEEVERLAGEVEVLRGVVEEGLKERRTVREVSGIINQSQADIGMSHDGDDEDDEPEEANVTNRHDADEDEDEEDEPEPFDPVSILSSARNDNTGTRLGDRTMRTDHATIGSSQLAQSQSTPPQQSKGIINSVDLERISAEVEERRTERSADQTHRTLRLESPPIRRATVQDASSSSSSGEDDDVQLADEEDSRRRGSPVPSARTRVPSAHSLSSSSSSRPSAPQPQPQQQPQQQPRQQRSRRSMIKETPFPQIRGTHLERLFFSAPDHNAKTCTVCNRRRRADGGGHGHGHGGAEPSWIPSRFRGRQAQKEEDEESSEEEDEDEGFAEEYEQPRRGGDRPGKDRVTFSKEPGPWRAQKEGLPPQTVVARVIRELEDDFTHYKGVYVELADQYAVMDATSDVARRNILAKHLREVVDILEQKASSFLSGILSHQSADGFCISQGDQIASLYDLLTFKDKPVADSVVPTTTGTSTGPSRPTTHGSKAQPRSVSNTAIASSTIGRGAGARRQVNGLV
ncbi:hypothetical protein H0H81_009238 [Sphagnurus paluster]|uniref:Cep57 centrosome microtubule-binding domain-containing protein n=1 Tax=Sphagnurus paluster TaxID=117069 RepID=A0A9P7GIJ2_9AGAR|nr:hypothetical protein H0H81_009238 [Sphagnurus paluster]